MLEKFVKCSFNPAHKIVLDMEVVLEFDNKDELSWEWDKIEYGIEIV